MARIIPKYLYNIFSFNGSNSLEQTSNNESKSFLRKLKSSALNWSNADQTWTWRSPSAGEETSAGGGSGSPELEVLLDGSVSRSGSSVVEDGNIKQVAHPPASIQAEAVVHSCRSRNRWRKSSRTGSEGPDRSSHPLHSKTHLEPVKMNFRHSEGPTPQNNNNNN